MKKRLLFLLLFLAVLVGGLPLEARRRWVPPVAAAGGPTYLRNQNFEGTGYDNGETWTAGGTVDPDYTTTVILGSQSCLINAAGYILNNVTAISDVWLFFKFQIPAAPSAGESFAYLEEAAGATNILFFNVNTSRVVAFLQAGTVASASSSCVLATSATYNCWMHYVASGTCQLYISQSTTRPTVDSVTECVLSVTSNVSTQVGQILFNPSTVGAINILFDHVLLSSSSIGDNP